LTGSKWNVQQETSWPTISSALLDLRHTTLSETYRLFGNSHRSNDNQPLDEQAYRNYLNVYKASNAGVNASLEHLEQLEAIQSRYHFIPLYQLYQVSAMDLYVNTNNAVYLDYAERFLNRAPKSIKMNTEFKRLEFNLLLLQDENDKAAQLIEELANLKVDRVLLNLLKVELAVRNNDYDTAVILERKNALLRPSLTKLYNLAVSEFSLGNIDLARQAINKALAIAPNDTDSYNMLGAIALTEGDIDQAIKSYTALVRREPDSYNLANLGLALMLNEDYTSAIGYLVRALEQNPDNPYFLLNLGDSYSLLGDQKSAQPYYQKVVDLDIDTRDATHYYSRAQAQAHLGQHYQAIKTLQSAKEVHSDTPDLAYSSAIVHAVAGNHSAAIVEVENAINTKMGTVWFNTKWFVDLCTYPNFINLFGREPPNICKTS
ncbi:MAG: tetratricopeptide repeat protein, partial [Arenicella sp.]|nr:tetratricopeptide repeat protein [Arenicella sp.]